MSPTDSADEPTSKNIDDSSEYRCYGGNGLRGYTKNYTHEGEYALIGRQGALCGNIQYVTGRFFASEHALVATPAKEVNAKWLAIYLDRMNLNQYSESSAQPGLSAEKLRVLNLVTPMGEEQTAIANALSDVDALISELEKLIAKKQAIKTATMQQLLTGRTRLPQFALREDGSKKGYKQSELGEIPEDWAVVSLGDAAKCLDNLRVPLNESQRSKMRGNVPYCGANGVVDWVNSYVIDDDIILMAEDGGYFDEYSTRPIAYRIVGKCWVNNHAHILQAKESFDQGYVFYSLVHKDIQKYLASGTRAKLNKSEMEKIEIIISSCKKEQIAIATILSDMDEDIQALEQRLAKTRQIKQGMMQALLTGKTRLVKPEAND